MKNGRVILQRNIRHFVLFLMAMLLLVTFRYAWVQLVEGNELSERVKNQVSGDYIVQSPRGAILDRNGRELAVSTLTKSLFVDPSHVSDADTLAAELAPLINVSEAEIKEDISYGGGFVWVKRRLSQSEYEAVRKLIREKDYISCLGFRDESKRFYPNDFLAANVIGFVGTDDKGLDGVEQSLDKYLKGEITDTFLYTDISQRPILDSIFTRRKYQGDNCKTVELTIDSAIQFIVEQELDVAITENKPQAITCVVMDPTNGEILAMANRPSYNPNSFWDYNDESWKNRAVSFIYEPGSTFKSVVAGAALQEGIVTPNQVFVDPGYIMVSGQRIQNWSGTSFGTVTFTDVVKNSLNTGFAQVGLRLGAQKLTDYALKFGFGEPTGIDLPGEESGILFDPEMMRDSDIATMAIGQSIAVTPLQLVTAMSAIANDGMLLKPHIVKSIKNADGSTYMESQKEEVRRTIDSATDKTLVGLLEQVVATGGGSKAQVKGYRIAGKTGTAQKIKSDGSGYEVGSYIASFCGFAPVESPRITVLVIIDEPHGVTYYGGQIAAPVAGRIFSQIMRYLNIAPSTDTFAYMNDEENENAPKPKRIEDVKQVDITADVPNGKVVVPDFRGKSIREAADAAANAGLVFNSQGSGFATSQSIEPNSVVDPNTPIIVVFSP